MQDLYTEQAFQEIHAQKRRRLMLLYVVSALLLALVVYSAVIRVQWLTMAAVILLGALVIFAVDLLILPIHRYEKLMRAALSGRTHTETLEYARLEPDISMVDGVPCRSLVFLGSPDKHGTRDQMYYWDESKPLPSFREGDRVTLRYTGKNIIAYQIEAL